MDQKLYKSYEKELMKMEMLKHEKIFREQVNELHRLYRVQKLLMSNMETSGIWRKPASRRQHYEERILDESEIQLTLGPSVYKTSSQKQHQKRSSSNYPTRRDDFGWSFAPTPNNGRRQVSVGEEHLRQERMDNHPPTLALPTIHIQLHLIN